MKILVAIFKRTGQLVLIENGLAARCMVSENEIYLKAELGSIDDFEVIGEL